MAQPLQAELASIRKKLPEQFTFKRIYIPTLGDKITFCQCSLEHMKTFDEWKEIAERLYSFIHDQNT